MEERFRAAATQALATNDTAHFATVLREEAAWRRSLGDAMMRSWQSPPKTPRTQNATMIITFAGLQQRVGGGHGGGVAPHEFVKSCRKAGAEFALFARDQLRSWYLRGFRQGGDFESVRLDMTRSAKPTYATGNCKAPH